MDNKIPIITSKQVGYITQEQAETEIFTSVKVSENYMKYVDLLESRLKIQDTAIERLNKENKNLKVLHRILWVANICFTVSFIISLLH